jgi:hypothetical protein
VRSFSRCQSPCSLANNSESSCPLLHLVLRTSRWRSPSSRRCLPIAGASAFSRAIRFAQRPTSRCPSSASPWRIAADISASTSTRTGISPRARPSGFRKTRFRKRRLVSPWKSRGGRFTSTPGATPCAECHITSCRCICSTPTFPRTPKRTAD